MEEEGLRNIVTIMLTININLLLSKALNLEFGDFESITDMVRNVVISDPLSVKTLSQSLLWSET